MGIKVGDTIPSATFSYVPYTPALEDGSACGVPVQLPTNEWKGKKVVLVSVPGAFTPTCHVNHMPPFVEKYAQFKEKGVDVLAFVAANDPFVMSAWGRVSGAKDKILFLSDADAKFATELGFALDLSARGFGLRTGRWALIIDDLKATYVGLEEQPAVSVSGADAVLAKL
ncbi:thioredoxin-dependent peroxidase [Gautieria morchelliformis]|nr:thioredoxin-dependent peroxidase [Gautieria morchelliformis]